VTRAPIAASTIAACTIAACVWACARSPAIERIEIDDPVAHWIDGGFAEMVPAIRLPTTPSGNDRITNWLRIPDGERIGVRKLNDGRIVPTYPAGTLADRIELREPVTSPEAIHAWNVIDVRGTQIDGDAERFHCLQPVGDGTLAGFAWPRGDADAERAAADQLVDLVASAQPMHNAAGKLHSKRNSHVEHAADRMVDSQPGNAANGNTDRTLDRQPSGNADARTARLERLRRLTHCEPCHVHGRRERTQISEGGPHRATDGAGFYSILAVLTDEGPLEDHRPRDLNAGDPFIAMARPSRGAVPRARLDLPRALATNRDHERAVCRSRQYLFDHMNDDARRAFAEAFAACGIPE
jgi:hypothetical protein